jgi:hypothetical protein
MNNDEELAIRKRRLADALREKISPENRLRSDVLTELIGHLWHTTKSDRFQSILIGGAILPNPNLPDSERWKTSGGKDTYSYVRILGGVSLFDFDQFEPDTYSEKCPTSSWYNFVPWRTSWGSSVWIEIDRHQMRPPSFISGPDLLAKWKSENAYRSIMPYIEAAYLGPVPITMFKRAFLASPEGMTRLELPGRLTSSK